MLVNATPVFAGLVPADVAVSETRRDGGRATAGGESLPEQERQIVSGAAPVRRREFTAGRLEAHAALNALAADATVIGRGEHGQPMWPAGVVGSITHCDGYVAAVVARTTQHSSIGIDVEPALVLPEGLLEEVASVAERAHLAVLTHEHPSTPWDRLLFCAKEACYKTWFPCERTWLGFEDAEVRLDPWGGSFTVELGKHMQPAFVPRRLVGRWGSTGDFVGAAIVL